MLTLVTLSRKNRVAPYQDSSDSHSDCRTINKRLAGALALIVAVLLGLTGVPVETRATGQKSETELAQETENPISELRRVTFQNNLNFGIGPNHRTNNELKILPIIPIKLNDNWNLVTRTILPVIKQPTLSTTDNDTWGLGASQFSAFLSKANSGSWTWGAGPIFQFPTTTDNALGSRKWGAGPTASVFFIEGPWVLGLLTNNVWSFAGSQDRPSVSQFLAQYSINYNFDQGWYLTTSPIITANWEGKNGDKWTVPLGGGVGKVFRIGDQPFNASLQTYSSVVRPDPGPDWTLRIQFTILFPR
jgi:hypothetical protein